MKIKEYLTDKRFSILFYFLLMAFISSIVYLDNSVRITLDNIIYLNSISLVMFIIYLSINYFFKRKYYLSIIDVIDQQENAIINLPEPQNYEQKLYNHLLKNLHEEQNIKTEKLLQEKRDNGDYITSWVHQIKTPIAVSRLIMENSSKNPMTEALNSLEDELDKIDDYVEQALYHSRIDSFSKDYFITEINGERIVKDLIKKHAKTFISKKMKLNIENLNLEISSDKKWLSFIMEQILSNSLKYTNKQGIINIYGEKNEKESTITIEDNGIGIKVEDVERVFHKGFTGSNGRDNYKSTGMGLYLAKELARKLGHELTIESSYEKYTKVTIHFPKLLDYFNVTKL